MRQDPAAQPSQFTFEPCFYTLQITLTALQPKPNQKVTIDPDSDFLLTGIHGTSTGTFTVNYKLPSGRAFSSNPVQNVNLIGTANQPTAIGPSPLYPANSSTLQFDLVDTSNAGNTIEIVCSGMRRYVVKS